MPDMKAMLKLQKAILELEPEELSGLIADSGKLDLPRDQRDGLVMMLIQGLGGSDSKAATAPKIREADAALQRRTS